MFKYGKWLAVTLCIAVVTAGCGKLDVQQAEMEPACKGRKCQVLESDYLYTRLANPDRTLVTDAAGKQLAIFTDGAYTVTLTGPERTFSEATTPYSVTHTTWVRSLPTPFAGQVDKLWLTEKLRDGSPDILAVAVQYISEAPPLYDESGIKIAGDADYGPLQADGTRQEGSDFNDYLGLPWSYGSTLDRPEPAQLNSLDCSGFIRMIWGYRSGLPLTLAPDGRAIPRRAFQILAAAPGVVITPDTGSQVTDFSQLAVGDLVFFDASSDDGAQIDHAGMFLGVDSAGYHRFLSSRKSSNGPTMGDYQGRSILEAINGAGLYATSFRAVRRL